MRRLAITVMFLGLVSSAFGIEPATYTNPIAALSVGTEGAWEDYGFGDPFVLRYNGRYYLYPSVRDDSVGVRCWSSRDLVSWKYEGYCTEDSTTRGAYAPEVFHGSDAFYLVTSPGGKGHYIYRSDSPTGPFERVTDNFGLSIDGSVFIDDDGRGYFLSASDKGVVKYRMDSETQVAPEPVLTYLPLNSGWTEGPTMFKHDGVYYMTYTGNHVLSRAYRVNAVSGTSHDEIGNVSYNPVLLSTEGALYGTGHNSIVKGPNLDLYYIVYHSLIGRGTTRNWPVRETNLDRLVLDGLDLAVAGPTRTPQDVPQPDAALWFDSADDLSRLRIAAEGSENAARVGDGVLQLGERSLVLLDKDLSGDFTAEYNLALPSGKGVIGAIFCWTDEKNFGSFEIEPSTNSAAISFIVDGERKARSFEIPRIFNNELSFKNLRSLQIERTGDQLTFYIEDRKIAEEKSPLPSSAIGYFSKNASDALFGFIGVTAWTQGRSARELTETAPGTIHVCYHAERPKSLTDRQHLTVETDEPYEIDLNVAESGYYDAAIYYSSRSNSVAELAIGANRTEVSLPNLGPEHGVDNTSIVRRLALSAGKNRLCLTAKSGFFRLKRIELVKTKEDPALDNFPDVIDQPSYSDGDWQAKNGALSIRITEGKDQYGKRLYGENGWGDCRVEAEITAAQGFFGKELLVRASEPAPGGVDNFPLGEEFYFGYSVSVIGDDLILKKCRYSEQILRWEKLGFIPRDRVGFRVDVVGNAITVYVNGEKTLEYVDPEPFLSGRVGVKGISDGSAVENLRVTPL